MVLTQKQLIKQIAESEGIDADVVRRVFESAEKTVLSHLSSAAPSENMIVKLLSGLSLESKYIPERKIHTFDDITCAEKVWAKPKLTRYFNRRLNGYYS